MITVYSGDMSDRPRDDVVKDIAGLFSERVVLAEPKKVNLSQLRIVMMDDDPQWRELIPIYLNERGVGKKVDAVSNFEALWERILMRNIDLVLLDKTCFVTKRCESDGVKPVPGYGREVAIWFRDYKPEIGVVLVSTEITEVDQSSFFCVDKKSVIQGNLEEFITKLVTAIQAAANTAVLNQQTSRA